MEALNPLLLDQGMRVLVADDSPVFQTVLRALLVKWGYEPVVVSDGEQAWKMLHEPDGPQLALLDWFMPGLDGVEVCRRLRATDTKRYVYILLITAADKAGSVVEAIEAGADDYITKPFKAEELRVRLYAGKRILASTELERQVQERTRELEERTRQLERSNKELEEFAYVASHDLQEPLRMVASYTTLLAKRYSGNLDDKADRYIAYAVDGAKRMQQLILDLLALSRVAKRAEELAPADCEKALECALSNLGIAVAETGALVTYDPLPVVLAEGSQLIQLFQNLVGNSLKFHSEQLPVVHVSAQDKGDEWLFAVRDNGIGIDPQHAERIFVIFQRLHKPSEYPGTGIGLAMCKKIVERHGGRIWVESEPGRGATFCFTFPKIATELANDAVNPVGARSGVIHEDCEASTVVSTR